MNWNDFPTVELPQGATASDLLALADAFVAQMEAARSARRGDAIPSLRTLDPVIEDAFGHLVAQRDALRALEAKRPLATEGRAKGASLALSNQRADRAWRALERVIDAGRDLVDEGSPGSADAEALHAELFGADGLRFITYRPRRQWEAGNRIAALLERPGVADIIEGLGGSRHLAAALAEHRAFGLSHGFIAARVAGPEGVTDTRDAQLALAAAVREYVSKVAARVSPRIEGSAAVADHLLLPYAEMVEDLGRSRRTPPKAATPEETKK